MKAIAGPLGVNRRALLSAPALLSMPALLRVTSALAQDSGSRLPSWNDGPAKQAIIDFVRATTDRASAKFVPLEERIEERLEAPLRVRIEVLPRSLSERSGHFEDTSR
jgi:hypothetical protein